MQLQRYILYELAAAGAAQRTTFTGSLPCYRAVQNDRVNQTQIIGYWTGDKAEKRQSSEKFTSVRGSLDKGALRFIILSPASVNSSSKHASIFLLKDR